jgi:hypothetical protein
VIASSSTPAWRMFRWFALFAGVVGTITQWWYGRDWWLISSLDQAWDIGQWVKQLTQDVSA